MRVSTCHCAPSLVKRPGKRRRRITRPLILCLPAAAPSRFAPWLAFLAGNSSTAEASRTSWLAIAREPPVEYAQKQKRYGEEQQEIQKKARELERQRDEKSKEADELLHHHHGFANAVALFQVSIALGAVAALTRSRPVWFGSLLLGAAATALFALRLFK